VTALRLISTDILAFNEIFANIEEADRPHVKTPTTLINAWIHITLALATFPSNQSRSLELAYRARSEISTGMKEIIAARSERLRLQNLVVLPFDLVALMSMKLCRDVTPNLPDTSATYGSYLNSIVSDFHRTLQLNSRPLTCSRSPTSSPSLQTGESNTSWAS
jgi:hypothetical protein